MVLVGLGLFVAGVLTGVEAFYWGCVAACVTAGVLLFLARRTLGPRTDPVATRAATGSATGAAPGSATGAAAGRHADADQASSADGGPPATGATAAGAPPAQRTAPPP